MSTTSEGTGNDHRNQRIQIHKYHHQRFKSLCAYVVNTQVRRTVRWRGVWIWLIKKRGTDKVFCNNFIQIWKQIFQPRADLLKLQCNVLCGGEREQVPGEEKEMKKKHISSSKSTKWSLQVNKMVSSGAVVAQYFETEGVSHFIHVNRSDLLPT